MLDELMNFLFGRKALQSAAGQTTTPKKKLPTEDQNPAVGVSQQDIGKMAQEQADNELRKKLAAQRVKTTP